MENDSGSGFPVMLLYLILKFYFVLFGSFLEVVNINNKTGKGQLIACRTCFCLLHIRGIFCSVCFVFDVSFL